MSDKIIIKPSTDESRSTHERIFGKRPESWEKTKHVKIIKGQCTCNAADFCPIGRVGSATRCSDRELIEKGIKVYYESV